MNCTRIQEMIPLFVEGDLDDLNTTRVAGHLKLCAVCSQSLLEFQESQQALKSYRTPAFDNLFFEQLKNSILTEIERSQPHVPFFQSMFDSWRLTSALATAALLMIAIVLGLYLYNRQAEMAPSPQPQRVEEHPKEENGPSEPSQTVVAEDKSTRRRGHRRRSHRAPLVTAVEQELEPLPAEQVIEPSMVAETDESLHPAEDLVDWNDEIFDSMPPEQVGILGEAAAWATSTGIASTKIEIQTSDPNVRIIWFAPSADSDSSTRTDTYTHTD